VSELTAATLGRWRADPVSFCADVLKRRDGTPWVPHDAQRQIMGAVAERDGGRRRWGTLCACWPKRSGKSELAAALCAWVLATRDGSRTLLLSTSREQAASVVFEKLLEFVKQSPLLAALVPEASRLKEEIACPATDAKVQVLPAKEATIQGRAPRDGFFVLDESHAQDAGLFAMALSQCDAQDAQALVVSMLGSPAGNVFALKEVADAGADPDLFFAYETSCPNPHVSERWLASRKAQLPLALFRVLHENQPGEGADALFDPDKLIECRADVELPRTREAWEKWCPRVLGVPTKDVRLGFGLDRNQPGAAKPGDAAVCNLTAAYLREGVRHYAVLRSDEIPGGTEAGIIAHAKMVREVFGVPASAVAEAYQSADLAGRLREPLGCEVALRHATSAYQETVFTSAWQASNGGRLMLFRELSTLFAQMVKFCIDTSKRTVSWGGGSGRAVDDHVYALAAALTGLADVRDPRPAGMFFV